MAANTKNLTGMRAFTLIWFGQLVSLLGTNMTRFALTLWAWELTGEATALALVAFFSFAPVVIFSPLAGALVDRWDRKLMMMVSDLAAGLGTVALFALAMLGVLEIWHVYIVAFFAAAFEAFQFPAYSAAITVMVDKSHYARTSAMLELAQSSTNIAAPIGAAMLFTLIGLQGILLIDIITFVFAVSTLFFITIPSVKRSDAGAASRGSLWSESLFGFKYIMHQPSLLGLQLVFFVGNLFFMITFVLVSPMILARTGNNETILGIVTSMMGAGGVAGGLLMSTWGGYERKIHGVLTGWMIAGLPGLIVMGTGQSIIPWVVGAFIMSFAGPYINASNQAIWQSKIPPDIQGKVFAARRLIAQIAGPLGILVAGPLADRIFEPAMQPGTTMAATFGGWVGVGDGAGMGLIFVIIGLLSIAISVGGYLVPVIRNAETLVPDFDAVAAAD